jgi:hypothetical protein
VTVTLTVIDVNALKEIDTLATSDSNTYVSITSALVKDMNDVPIIALDTNNAMQVTTFVADETAPQLMAYSIDMNLGFLWLTFDETVNASSMDVTQLSFWDSATELHERESEPESERDVERNSYWTNYSLTGLAYSVVPKLASDKEGYDVPHAKVYDLSIVGYGETDNTDLQPATDEEVYVRDVAAITSRGLGYTYGYGHIVQVKFTFKDLNEIKRLPLCTQSLIPGQPNNREKDCYLTTTAGLVKDMFRNEHEPFDCSNISR